MTSKLRPFMVSTGRIKRLTVATTELDAAAKVLAKAIYEHLKSRKGWETLRLGKVLEITSEDGRTTWLLTETGYEQINPPTGAQEETKGFDT